MGEDIKEVEKIENEPKLNEKEREKLKEFLKKNLQIMIGNEKIEEDYDIKKDWKEKFENNKIYNKINIIFDIMWTKSLPYLAFKHSSFDKNSNDLNSLKRSIYPIFYLYTDSKTQENKYLVLAFGRWIAEYDKYSAIDWDKRINNNFSTISSYFDKNKIDVNEKNRINSFNFYKLYVIKNNNLSEDLDKILCNFEKILEYYVSYIDIYNKLKELIKGYQYSEERMFFYNHYMESNFMTEENELKNILEYFIEDFKIRYEVKTLEKYKKICRIFEKYLVDRKDNNLKNVLKQFIRHLVMRRIPYDQYIEMLKECNEIYYKFDDDNFKFSLNTILYGPPGTGKTYNSIFYSVGIVDKDRSIIDMIEEKNNNILDEKIFLRFKELKEVKEEERQIEFITFHQSYSYEDFVEGIRPTLATKDSEDNKDLKYTIHSGIFKKICERARNDKDKNYVLIIDEINRGNISKIFGELITLLEPSKRLGETEELKIRLAYSGEEFGVPKNLYILGTMNTADRSIALLDIALRRRFNFIEMPPKYDLLREKIEVENDKIELQELLKAINNRIEFLLDKDHLIGHSYLVKVETFDDLKEVFRNSIMPLLQEYFYDDFEKIKVVLNIDEKDKDSFIIKKETPQNFSGTLKTRLDKKSVYEINEKAFDDHKKYSKIYPEEAPTKADKNITEKVEPHDN